MIPHSSEKIINTALQMIEHGLSIIPVKNKVPLLTSSKVYQKKIPTKWEIKKWFNDTWPDANIGLMCGSVSGIFCIDADNETGVEWLKANTPETTVYDKTPSGGIHAFFRIPNEITINTKIKIFGSGDKLPEIDILGEKHLVTIYNNSLIGFDALPEWDCNEIVPEKKKYKVDLSLRNLEPVVKGERNDMLARKAGRWTGIGLTYDEVLMSLKMWNDEFCVPPIENKEFINTVQSIYKKHQENNPQTQISKIFKKEDEPFPEHLLNPGGLLTDIMDYVERSSAASHPVFDLALAIVILGGCAGFRIETETGLKTNFYCICLGYSGSGKNASHQAINRLLGNRDTSDLIASSHPTSDAAILKYLGKSGQESAIFRIDEIGYTLKKARSPRSPAHQIPTLLTAIIHIY